MILYHYCSVDAFYNIMKNKTLRLTNLAHTNDSEEITFGMNQFFKFYTEITGNEPSDSLRKFIFLNNRGAYATCFSENSDLLSQWRGYADDGKGFSIGFDFDVLDIDKKYPWNSSIKKDAFAYEKIIYEYEEVKRTLNNNEILKQRGLKDDIPTLETFYSIFIHKESTSDSFDHLIEGLGDIIFFIKNPAFFEEQEWRLVYRDTLFNTFSSKEYDESNTELNHLGRKHFYKKNDIISSCFDWDFSEHLGKNLIKNIVLGPNCKCEPNDIAIFLHNNGIKVVDVDTININIDRSKASYRS